VSDRPRRPGEEHRTAKEADAESAYRRIRNERLREFDASSRWTRRRRFVVVFLRALVALSVIAGLASLIFDLDARVMFLIAVGLALSTAGAADADRDGYAARERGVRRPPDLPRQSWTQVSVDPELMQRVLEEARQARLASEVKRESGSVPPRPDHPPKG
jgi:hypothetical protein